jgi:hypothetical protein
MRIETEAAKIAKQIKKNPHASRLLGEIADNKRVFAQYVNPFGWVGIEGAGLAVRSETDKSRAELTEKGLRVINILRGVENEPHR